MIGFFSEKELRNSGASSFKNNCYTCGLYKNGKHPRQNEWGEFRKKILIVSEFPTVEEDRKGVPWCTPAGRFLRKELDKLGIDLEDDCLSVFGVRCQPLTAKNKLRVPTEKEVDLCSGYVQNLIKNKNPKLIFIFGTKALSSVLKWKWKKGLSSISKWSGFIIPDQDYDSFICPLYHPKYVLDMERPDLEKKWKEGLANAIKYLNKKVPTYKNLEKNIEIVDDISFFNKMQPKYMAFDYETTGLQPYEKGHKIICASVSFDGKKAYGFMTTDKEKIKPFIRLLRNPKILKLAHNMKFEDTWTNIIFKTKVRGWYWDSMIAAHIIDNRTGISGLKFQVFVNFGISDYDSDINPYLHAVRGSFNKVEHLIKNGMGKKKLLIYCGLDSLLQYKLAMKQMKIIGGDK